MNNEDCFNVVEIPDKRTLFVACDGMGGHSCGEVASQTVCDSFSTYWEEHPEQEDSKAKVLDAVKEASRILDEKSGYYQMGTILVMCSIEGKRATIAHAGDSRCYVIDIKGNVKYRTIDHIESSSISLVILRMKLPLNSIWEAFFIFADRKWLLGALSKHILIEFRVDS